MITNIFVASLFLTVTLAASINQAVRRGCPKASDLQPYCKCTDTPYTTLECAGIESDETLNDIFARISNYEFKVFYLKNSAFLFIPNGIFKQVSVREIYLKNSTVLTLFGETPEELEMLDTLQMDSTTILRSLTFEDFTPLTHLRVLTVHNLSVKSLGKEFSKYVTKGIKQISFNYTRMRGIKEGALKEFVNLERVEFDFNKFKELNRNVFPVPFNVRFLSFRKNQLSVIPDDLFNEMPRLQYVDLRNNSISLLPESAFKDSVATLESLELEGNPLMCDCRLLWLVKNKPSTLSGRCNSPPRLHGKRLTDLSQDDLKC